VDRTNRNVALASAFVEELARCGLREAVISPGSRSTPLALALWRAPAIRCRVLVDERSAGFFALGAAQASRVPVALLTTSGTAAANLHPAVSEADESAVPLIVMTADRPPELRGIGAGQTIDQLKLYGSAVRWFCEVGTHEADDAGLLHFRSVACRAYAVARGQARPRPVHLNVAWRDPLGPEPHEDAVTATSALALHGRGERPLTAVPGSPPAPDSALLDELAERVAATERGLIVCGRQADPLLAEPIARLARSSGYPVLAEPTSQLRLAEPGHDGLVWTYDAIARARPHDLAPKLVIRFGEMPTSKALRRWLGSSDDVRQVLVDPAYGWNEPSARAEAIVRADPKAFAAGIAERLGPTRSTEFTESWTSAGVAAAEAIAGELASEAELTEPGVHRALAQLYDDEDLVYTGSSMPIRDQEAFLPPARRGTRFLCNRGANGIDGLVSSGIGAARASGRPTWIVTGDLGFFHDMNGLAALDPSDPPVRIVVLNNSGGGIFELLPQADQLDRDEFEALFATPVHFEVAKAAALHDLAHLELSSISDLDGVPPDRHVVVEARVDRRNDTALRHRVAEAAIAASSSQAP